MARSPEEIRDELLVLGAQAGEARAFARLVARWQGRLLASALARGLAPDAARDAVQETWLALLRDLPRLRDPSRFPAFAHRILKRRIADGARRSGRQHRLREAMGEALPPAFEQGAEQEQDRRRVRGALARLSDDLQQLVVLRYRDGLSVPEIARTLALPPGTVKSRLHTALARLEQALRRTRA